MSPLQLITAATVVLLGLATTARATPGSANCTENWFDNQLDHYRFSDARTYRQRYFTYDKYWKPGGTIFFYLGNEDNVELYVNNTGLMWENAEEFQALLVFAEHRFYGESRPFAAGTPGCMDYLTTEQALADFATLLTFLKKSLESEESTVIGFGGSYGGMMATWFRLKYPAQVHGVIAGSAPVWSFENLHPPYDFNAFDETVTYDATPAAGAAKYCAPNLLAAQPMIPEQAKTESGRALLAQTFRTCAPLATEEEAQGLLDWIQEPWGTLAMGNFPYASSYLLHGHGLLPAWPMRVACEPLSPPHFAEPAALLSAVRDAVGVFYNHTGTVQCFYNGPTAEYRAPASFHSPPTRSRRTWRRARDSSLANDCSGTWDYQYCTEMVQPFASGLGKDMFWPAQPFDLAATAKGCKETWGVETRAEWATITWGGKDLRAASNIVFSNGLLDPWHGGGVLANQSASVVAIIIPNGAHHADLMFSNPADPPEFLEARRIEKEHMHRWVEEHTKKR